MEKAAPRRFYFILYGHFLSFSREDTLKVDSDVYDVFSTQALDGVDKLKKCLSEAVIFLKKVMGNSKSVILYTNFLTDTLLAVQNLSTK